MPKQTAALGRRWYVLHTYSGYEENVAENLRQRIESMDMQDKIYNVLVPTEKKIKIKNGKRKVITEKIFPGYVLVEMIVTDDSWYVVRNTPNVTVRWFRHYADSDFRREVKELQRRMGIDQPTMKLDLLPSDTVRITDNRSKIWKVKCRKWMKCVVKSRF